MEKPREQGGLNVLDHDAAGRLWRHLHACATLIEQDLHGRLQAQFGTSYGRFALIAALATYPGGLPMGEVSRRLNVASGTLTGLVDQLEREGVLVRIRVKSDRRLQVVELTDVGRTILTTISPEYERWVLDLLSNVPLEQSLSMVTQLTKLQQTLTSAQTFRSGSGRAPQRGKERTMLAG